MKRLIVWGGLAAALLAGIVWYVYSDHYFTQRLDAAADEIVTYGEEIKARFPANTAVEHFRKAMSTVGDELKRYNKQLNLEKLTRRERIEKLKARFLESMTPYMLSSENLPPHIKRDDLAEMESHLNPGEMPTKLLKILHMPTGHIDASPPKESLIERALERIGFD